MGVFDSMNTWSHLWVSWVLWVLWMSTELLLWVHTTSLTRYIWKVLYINPLNFTQWREQKDEYSVFPRHCFSFKLARVISLFGVQLSAFIHLFHVKTVIFDIVFWGFHFLLFFVFIENTKNWMFQVSNQNPRLKFHSAGL